MQIQLLPGERVLKVGKAGRSYQNTKSFGVLCLTSGRILFLSGAGEQEAIWATDVQAIRPANTLGLLPLSFAVELPGGIEVKYTTSKRGEWMEMLDRVRTGRAADIPNAEEVILPDAGGSGPIDSVVSWPAIMAWIAAPFALIPLLGLIPALVVLVAAFMLLIRPKRFQDTKVGIAAAIIAVFALVASSVTILSSVTFGLRISGGGTYDNSLNVTWSMQVLQVVVLIFSIVVHECGHALAAYWSGDDTSVRRQRLTLNPIPHVDLMGSIIIPGILILSNSSAVFGWAKPVPVNLENLRNRFWGNVAVSLAGVSANLLLAGLALSLLGIIGSVLHLTWPEMTCTNFGIPFRQTQITGVPLALVWAFIADGLKMTVILNLVLLAFNLLPVPPLDGSHILGLLLPRQLAEYWERVKQYGFFLLVILIFTGVTGSIIGAVAEVGLYLCLSVGLICGLG